MIWQRESNREKTLLDVVMADFVTMKEVDTSKQRLEPSASLGFVNLDGDEAGEVFPRDW